MKLYHGTSLTAFNSIKVDGIKPRRNVIKPNWSEDTNVPGHPEMVYLTRTKISAEFHALNAAINKSDNIGVVLELDTNDLDVSCLRVDEHYLDLLQRGFYHSCPISLRKVQVEQAYGDCRWEESLEKVGLCCHVGKINIISKNYIIDNKDNIYYRPEFFKHSSPSLNRKELESFLNKNIPFNITHNKWQDYIDVNGISKD